MKAILRNYRQSPRKVRLITDLIRGKSVPEALVVLSAVTKRASEPVRKLLLSSVANAVQKDATFSKDNLYIKEIRTDEGPTMKRGLPRAFGRSTVIRKRTSHISILLGEKIKKESKPSNNLTPNT